VTRPSPATVLPRGHVPLERALSKLGIATRGQARQLVAQRRVTVGGVVAEDPLQPVVPERTPLAIDGQPVASRVVPLTIALHKPRGYITTRHDPQGRKTIYELLGDVPQHVIAVGRLDQATSGLLLLTNDTRLSDRLLDPQTAVVRRYLAEVEGRVTAESLARLTGGIDDRGERLEAAAVTLRKASGRESQLILSLTEGKNREVRRLCAAIGHPLRRLKRIAYGPVELGDLPTGQWRTIDSALLYAAAGLPARTTSWPRL
jgi:23S rRNA pseudouridine2605 synthase